MSESYYIRRKVKAASERVNEAQSGAAVHSSAWLDAIVCGDCLNVLSELPDKSVSAIITDPPYATTTIAWDKPQNWQAWWEQANRVCNGVVVMTSSQPFTTDLINSNRGAFRYEWIWQKSRSGSALTAKHRPVKLHENVLVFVAGEHRYAPEMRAGKPYSRNGYKLKTNNHGIGLKEINVTNLGTRFPTTLLDFKQDWSKQQQVHPTQKPVELMRYLVRTYTKPGETVLDPFCGSGATCIAAMLEGRKYIGIDTDESYVQITNNRIAKARGLGV